jgi:hypothetical protein
MDRSHPAIASALNSFDKDWIVGGVSQGVAQAHDGAADALLKIHKDVRGPESLAELLARDDLSRPGQQERQGTEWQVLKTELDAIASELAGGQIGFENTEANRSCRYRTGTHKRVVAGEFEFGGNGTFRLRKGTPG